MANLAGHDGQLVLLVKRENDRVYKILNDIFKDLEGLDRKH